MPGVSRRDQPRPHRPDLAVLLRQQAQGGRARRLRARGDAGRDGHAHPDRDVPDRAVRPPAARPGRPSRTRWSARRRTWRSSDQDRRPRHRAAQERRARCCRCSTRTRAVDRGHRRRRAASTRRPPPAGRPPCCRRSRSSPRWPASPPAPAAASTVTYAQGTLGVAGPLPAVPASAFGSGLTATYYASSRPVRPADRHRDRCRTWTSPATRPPSPGSAVWSARYTGTLTAPADRRLPVLAVRPAGTSRVWIDGTPVGQLRADPRAHAERPDPPDRRRALRSGSRSRRSRRTLVTVDAFAITAGLHLGWQPQEDLLVAQAAAAAHAADVAVVVVVRAGQRGHGPQHPRPARRPGQADRRGGRGQPAHRRRAQHLQRGARCRGSARSAASSRRGTPARPPAPRWPRCCSATSTRPASCR